MVQGNTQPVLGLSRKQACDGRRLAGEVPRHVRDKVPGDARVAREKLFEPFVIECPDPALGDRPKRLQACLLAEQPHLAGDVAVLEDRNLAGLDQEHPIAGLSLAAQFLTG